MIEVGYEIEWQCPLGRMRKGIIEIIDGELLRVRPENGGSARWVLRSSVKKVKEPEDEFKNWRMLNHSSLRDLEK